MTASQKESKVVDLLRELIVATIDVVCAKLTASRSTVLRALKSYAPSLQHHEALSCGH